MNRWLWISLVGLFLWNCNTLTTPNTPKHIEGTWEKVPVDSPQIIWTFNGGDLAIEGGPYAGDYSYEVIEQSTDDFVKIYKNDTTLYQEEKADRWKVIEADDEELYMISQKQRGEDNLLEGDVTLEFIRR
jgi:hypothetical protein